jgi:outer membrane protein OmpA-like peptidoglycan-associated protein
MLNGMAKRIITAVLLTAGCTAPSLSRTDVALQLPPDAQFGLFASDIATDAPGTQIVTAPAGTCGPMATPVVRVPFAERVLFATASDQPETEAAAALADLANVVMQDAPDAALTVLGHTDAMGSDGYNMDLSKRRAVTVLHALVARGLNPDRLTAVAIGKRQPVADNATPEGRALNRRVEFLVSACLAANLGVVAAVSRNRALLPQDADLNRPVDVMRLDPGGRHALVPLRTLALKPLEGGPARAASALPAATTAQPARSSIYKPRTPSPPAQPKPLGPPIPF